MRPSPGKPRKRIRENRFETTNSRGKEGQIIGIAEENEVAPTPESAARGKLERKMDVSSKSAVSTKAVVLKKAIVPTKAVVLTGAD